MNKLNVFKVGGQILEDEKKRSDFVSAISNIQGKKLIVHGGGRTASSLSERLGIQPKMIDGRRITDANTLDVVTMVYAGLLNKKLVAQLQQNGVSALGLSGADLNSIQAHKRKIQTIDYGFVGDIDIVNDQAINLLIQNDICPVFCAITHDGNGQLLNTNADTIASHLGMAMSENYDVDIYFCFEKAGVLEDAERDDTLIPHLSYQHYQELKLNGQIHLGMIPKLDNAFYALLNGCENVYICHINALADFNNLKGTHIC